MWKDVTSYSKYGERVPTTWEIKTKNLRIVVINSHRYYPGSWIMHCRSLGMTEKEIGKTEKLTTEQAQQIAISVCREALNTMAKEIESLCK